MTQSICKRLSPLLRTLIVLLDGLVIDTTTFRERILNLRLSSKLQWVSMLENLSL